MVFHYVYFNASYAPKTIIDLDDYNAICTRDLEALNNVQVVPCIMAHKSKLFRFVYYCFAKILKGFGRDLLKLWYPTFFKKKFTVFDEQLCFIVASSRVPVDYLVWLKKKHPKAKFIRVHRDLYKITCRNGYTLEFTNSFFDVQMSFDKKEAKEHHALYFDEIESKIDVSGAEQYPKCDVFFAGKAKDRLNSILQALRILNEAGLNCNFYVTDVPKYEQTKIEGLVYGEKLMPYKEMLFRSIRAKCILEINQEGAVGYTSRFIEAVLYNKKLITNNQFIKESPFYNESFIQCISNIDDLDASFVRKNTKVDFNYNGEFSPINIIRILENYFKTTHKEGAFE